MKCKIYQDQAGLFRWRLVSNNGRVMADSGEGYSTISNCRRAFNKLIDRAYWFEDEDIEVVKTVDN